MTRPLYQTFARVTQTPSMPILGIAGGGVLELSLCSCSLIPSAHRVAPLNDEGVLPPRYSIVCIIHGDGNYLYHDTRGDAQRADEVTLDKIRMVAARNKQAEVFIFHESPRKHFLLFFPRRDGRFYYYRHGRLLAEESYWRDHGQLRFDPEIELYSRFRAEESPELARLFLHFDLSPLEQLDMGLRGGDVSGFANTFAHHAFDSLTEDVQTSVTVAVYDADRAQEFFCSVGSIYDQTLTKLKDNTPGSIEHCDCAEDPAYALPVMKDGVLVLYRPSHFERLAHKKSHSGWECWKLLN
jgi:hypothetical protein